MSELFNLAGKVAIVTGGASGIGRATALVLGEHGCDISIADMKLKGAEETAEEVRAMGRRAMVVETDVSKVEQTKRLVDRTIKEYGKIDILANVAGFFIGAYTVEETEEKDWDRIMGTNLKGVAFLCKAAIPHMKERKSGRIINVGSSASSRGATGTMDWGSADYCASKAGVQCLTRVLARELGGYGITSNAVAPGIVDTPMIAGYEPMFERASYIPIGRVEKPEDIAQAILFLASDAASTITGQTLHVNGGAIMVD
jgi:3-oxoacyl-[acyl-carrier protein] reductase